MTTKLLSIAKEYTETPAGRYRSDGPYSGERFRDEFLYPALKGSDQVKVDLDGTLGYGSSFLEEAFGGLIREKGMALLEIKEKLQVVSGRKLYLDRVWSYIEDAATVSKNR